MKDPNFKGKYVELRTVDGKGYNGRVTDQKLDVAYGTGLWLKVGASTWVALNHVTSASWEER